MKTSRQLSIGPMALERVSGAVANASNSVAAVDLCDLLDRAYRVEGFTAGMAAGMLGMSPQSYSKAIGKQYVDNPVMKALGRPENRKPLLRFLALACEAVGLNVGDAEQARVLRDFARVLAKAVNE